MGVAGSGFCARVICAGAVLVALVGGAWAQEGGAAARVARVTYLRGEVVVDRLDNTGSDPAQMNMPLAEGTKLSTGDDGQAEVEFEDGSLVRVTPNSMVTLTRLGVNDAGNYQTTISLGYGLAYAELRSAVKYVYSFEAGSMAVSPATNATFRVNLDEPPAVVAVFDGTVHVREDGAANVGGYRLDVKAGESIRSDVADSSRYVLTKEVTPDTWDQWNDARDREALGQASKRTGARDGYAANAGYGWSDLDANGTWYDVPGQGEVWQPDVASQDATSFDPYGSGAWVWTPGPGYVWASAYTWGWTPYRCGSWSYWGGFGWGWAPGAGCGFGGWGVAGAGFGGRYNYNIAQAPVGYAFRPLPGGGWRGGAHPGVVVVKAAAKDGEGARPVRVAEGAKEGAKTIAGLTVVPLRPLGSAVAGGGVTGAALRRDFPVDPDSRKPVIGTVAETAPVRMVPVVARPEPGVVRMRPDPPAEAVSGAGRQPYVGAHPAQGGAQGGAQPSNAQRGGEVRPVESSRPVPAAAPRPAPSAAPASRSAGTSAPAAASPK